MDAAGRTVTNRPYYKADQVARLRQEARHPGPRQRVAYCCVNSQSRRPNRKRAAARPGGILRGTWISRCRVCRRSGRRHEFVAHRDRLTRFGYEWFVRFGQQHACEIMVLNQEHLPAHEELVQDLSTIVFSARLHGLRNYRTRLKEALNADVGATDPAKSDTGSNAVL